MRYYLGPVTTKGLRVERKPGKSEECKRSKHRMCYTTPCKCKCHKTEENGKCATMR
jgi:hypothetical protein